MTTNEDTITSLDAEAVQHAARAEALRAEATAAERAGRDAATAARRARVAPQHAIVEGLKEKTTDAAWRARTAKHEARVLELRRMLVAELQAVDAEAGEHNAHVKILRREEAKLAQLEGRQHKPEPCAWGLCVVDGGTLYCGPNCASRSADHFATAVVEKLVADPTQARRQLSYLSKN